jgi:tetratricopeptide (TPR) repeat protein
MSNEPSQPYPEEIKNAYNQILRLSFDSAIGEGSEEKDSEIIRLGRFILEKQPNFNEPFFFNIFGHYLAKSGDLDAGIAYLEKATSLGLGELDPENPEMTISHLWKKIIAYVKAEDYDKSFENALLYVQRVREVDISIGDDNWDILDGIWPHALQNAELAKKYNQAFELIKTGDSSSVKQGLPILDAFIAEAPDYPPMWIKAALNYRFAGDILGKDGSSALEKAEKLYRKALEFDSNFSKAIEGLEKIRQIRESHIGKKGSCFIATAAYGSDSAYDVIVLKRFRDKVILSSELGRVLISLYYSFSPPLARLIQRNKALRIFSRMFLIHPMAYLCAQILHYKDS